MSLRAARGGLRPHRRGGNQAMVELTPLIDIVFQLLIFFLLTATFQNSSSIQVNIPKAKSTEVTQEPKAVVVTISAGGEYDVNGRRVDRRELKMRLCAAGEDGTTTGVHIKADEATQHQYVVAVMDLARQCGLKRLGILHRR